MSAMPGNTKLYKVSVLKNSSMNTVSNMHKHNTNNSRLHGIVFKDTFPRTEEARMTHLMHFIQALLYKETFLHTTLNNFPYLISETFLLIII